ncbi:MAG: glycine cleavage system protein GcvH [Bacteroidia bacterium]|nr:MAG: glycine cleavage system protein GcvH [Bacteroidia bacterium]
MKISSTHEWLKIDHNNLITIGITEHAQSLLGDLVYVELPDVGSIITKGSTFGVIESVKAASDLYAPINMEVVEINEAVKNDPSIINQAPHTNGWLVKVHASDLEELNELMDNTTYQNTIK